MVDRKLLLEHMPSLYVKYFNIYNYFLLIEQVSSVGKACVELFSLENLEKPSCTDGIEFCREIDEKKNY
jgi:hypothetical protein